MQYVDIKDSDYNIVAENLPLIDAPLWWHDKGLTQTATGYGRKLTTRYKVAFKGRLYRVYCTHVSNVGSLWFTAMGVRYIVG